MPKKKGKRKTTWVDTIKKDFEKENYKNEKETFEDLSPKSCDMEGFN